MQIFDQGIVAISQPGTDRQSCAFPGVSVLASGRWLVSFRAAPTKIGLQEQHVLVSWSDDDGETWSEPSRPFQPPRYAGSTPGTFRAAYITQLADNSLLAALCWVDHTDPARPFYNEDTEGLLDTRICLSRSHDDGATWSPPEFAESEFSNVPTPLTGPILRLVDTAGKEQLAIQFEINKPYDDLTPWHHRSVLLLSTDSGVAWPAHSVASDDPQRRIFYWDQRPVVLDNNEILNLFWTFDRVSGEYLNIHARRSQNAGLDWSSLHDTGVPGQPAQGLQLPDGRLVMVYVDRTTVPAIRLRISTDNGARWPKETERTLFTHDTSEDFSKPGDMQAAWDEMSRFALGLPATAMLPDGDALVVFYSGRSADETSIQWLRLHDETTTLK